VGLKNEYFRALDTWLEWGGIVSEGFDNEYLPEKGIFTECNERYDADKGYSYSKTMYTNDKGLLYIADIINQNKEEFIGFYYQYVNQ
jgi:hypothetical protein